MVLPAISALILLMDQLTKAWVAREIPLGYSRVVWPGLFALTHVRNAGAAFGLLQLQIWLFVLLALAVLAAALCYRRRIARQPFLIRLGLGLALGGTLGNLIDRLRFGRVCDFLDFYYWPVFNVADTAIFCGIGLIILGHLIASKPGAHGG